MSRESTCPSRSGSGQLRYGSVRVRNWLDGTRPSRDSTGLGVETRQSQAKLKFAGLNLFAQVGLKCQKGNQNREKGKTIWFESKTKNPNLVRGFFSSIVALSRSSDDSVVALANKKSLPLSFLLEAPTVSPSSDCTEAVVSRRKNFGQLH